MAEHKTAAEVFTEATKTPYEGEQLEFEAVTQMLQEQSRKLTETQQKIASISETVIKSLEDIRAKEGQEAPTEEEAKQFFEMFCKQFNFEEHMNNLYQEQDEIEKAIKELIDQAARYVWNSNKTFMVMNGAATALVDQGSGEGIELNRPYQIGKTAETFEIQEAKGTEGGNPLVMVDEKGEKQVIHLTPEAKRTLDTFITLQNYRTAEITVKDFYREMVQDKDARPSTEKVLEILAMLRFFSCYRIHIDITESYEKFYGKIPHGKKAILEGNIIDADFILFANDKTILSDENTKIIIGSKRSPLLQDALERNQILYVPKTLLNAADENGRQSDRKSRINDYILQWLWTQNGCNKKNTFTKQLRLETMYEKTHLTVNGNTKTKQDILKITEERLQAIKENSGELPFTVVSYSRHKEGRTITGIDIEVKKNKTKLHKA